MKKKLQFVICSFVITLFLNSCLVVNNLYVNDPFPAQKDSAKFYLGLGTGITPKIDSVSSGTNAVYYSGKISRAALLAGGVQCRLTDNLNLRLAAYLPRIIGGFGMRVGTQYSIFNAGSKFNMALGIDLGFGLSRDSIKIGGTRFSTGVETGAGGNADFFLPIGYKIKKNVSVVLTPRYSFNNIHIKTRTNGSDVRNFKLYAPILSLGIKIHRFYMEATAIHYNDSFYPQAGFGLVF